jgi:hypothetical protein
MNLFFVGTFVGMTAMFLVIYIPLLIRRFRGFSIDEQHYPFDNRNEKPTTIKLGQRNVKPKLKIVSSRSDGK